jgi:three-Cys-motif partner protein
MSHHEFGGEWTIDKLERIRKYLSAYTRIFHANERARYLFPIYLDAFAGTGYHSPAHAVAHPELPLPELTEPDNQEFLKGSTRIALDVEPPFKQYIFIEKDPERVKELADLEQEYPRHAGKTIVVPGDANTYLKDWCDLTSWDKRRAVVFLDPYGMQVEWSTIESIAKTEAIDLWILFPLGVAVNRLLRRNGPPPESEAKALTRIFGTDDWLDEFYPQKKVLTLFGEEETRTKEADFNKIGQYFVNRLKSVFTKVADNPLPLMNSRNNPLYLLCFAAGNPKGAQTGVKIAQDILRR